jgi:hypothetical protein
MIIPDDFILVCVKFLVNKGYLKVSYALTFEVFRSDQSLNFTGGCLLFGIDLKGKN